jgi:iron only hydrogenase large subunit-like protein
MASQELQTPDKTDASKRAKLENGTPKDSLVTAGKLATVLESFNLDFGKLLETSMEAHLSSTGTDQGIG